MTWRAKSDRLYLLAEDVVQLKLDLRLRLLRSHVHRLAGAYTRPLLSST